MSQAKTLNEEELNNLLSFLKTQRHGIRDRAIVQMSYLSGMRVAEIASLRISHVLDAFGNVRNEIRLTADQTKGKYPRTVFVNTKLKEELANYLRTVRIDDSERALFATQKNPRKGFTANTLTQHFLHIYRKSGIDGASSHSGRRTYATQIASQGTSLRVLMRLMGHRNISTTAVYIDANDNMLRNAVELLAQVN